MMLLNCGVGEDSWESFYCKEIKPVNPKGDQPWVFIGRTDSEAETPILWSSDGKSWLIRKDSDAGKDWRQEKRMTEVEILGWHHQLITNSPEQAPEDGEEQGTLTCCSPWVHKESDTTVWLNWTELIPAWWGCVLDFFLFSTLSNTIHSKKTCF